MSAYQVNYHSLDKPLNPSPVVPGYSPLNLLYPGRPMKGDERYYEYYEIPNEDERGARESYINSTIETKKYSKELLNKAIKNGGGDKNKVTIHSVEDPSELVEDPSLKSISIDTPAFNDSNPFQVGNVVRGSPYSSPNDSPQILVPGPDGRGVVIQAPMPGENSVLKLPVSKNPTNRSSDTFDISKKDLKETLKREVSSRNQSESFTDVDLGFKRKTMYTTVQPPTEPSLPDSFRLANQPNPFSIKTVGKPTVESLPRGAYMQPNSILPSSEQINNPQKYGVIEAMGPVDLKSSNKSLMIVLLIFLIVCIIAMLAKYLRYI